jgi:hypothetical protein
MEILTGYVRERARWREAGQRSNEDISSGERQPTHDDLSRRTSAIDIQAVLTVLGRRTRIYGKGEDRRLNLERVMHFG